MNANVPISLPKRFCNFAFAGSRVFHILKSGVATAIEEYEPEIKPITMANAKSCSVSPPNNWRECCVNGAQKYLVNWMICHCHKAATDVQFLHVVVNAVEHNNRVVKRISQNGKQRGDSVRRNFASDKGIHAHNDNQVVQERHQAWLIFVFL